jgi:hypothetical protein
MVAAKLRRPAMVLVHDAVRNPDWYTFPSLIFLPSFLRFFSARVGE